MVPEIETTETTDTTDVLDLSDLDVEGLERRLELATGLHGIVPDWSVTVTGHA